MEVKKLSRLARLSLSDHEEQKIAQDFKDIINMIQILSEVDTHNINPLTSVSQINLRFADDIVSNNVTKESLMENVNDDFAKRIGCFIVPKVIE